MASPGQRVGLGSGCGAPRSSGSWGRSRSTRLGVRAAACRAGARSRCWRCSWSIAARSSTSTGSSTSCGRAPARGTRRRPSTSWCRGCARRWARPWWSRRGAATPCAWPRAGSTPSASRRSTAAVARSSRAASRGRRRPRCARRSRCGAARRWPTSARSASPSRRSRGWRTCAWPAWAIASTPTWRAATTPRSPASSRRWCASIRCTSACAGSRCSRCTRRTSGRRPGRIPQRLLGAGRRPWHRALAAAARARGRDPAPGRRAAVVAGAAATLVGRATTRRLVTCVVARLAHRDGQLDLDAESLQMVLVRFHDDGRATCAGHGGMVGRAARRRRPGRLWERRSRTRTIRSARFGAADELVARCEELPFGMRACCGVCTGEVRGASGARRDR